MEILFSKCKIAHARNLLLIENKNKKILEKNDIIDGLEIFLENPEIKKRGEKDEYNNIIKTLYV